MSTEDDNENKITRITRKGQVTIPKPLRDEFGLEEGDKIHWEKTGDGIRVRKATRSAGRGMLVDDTVTDEKREEMAEEMEADIREMRRTEWQP
ncbi:AbrB/MazE/SpoVT family DNA-binding domain-containing protein [Halohasta litorea]|uniref:AbrB/MazE/SpoVT family DNA-binding domain-containing protein n=1 Tax=Halohasta litorea TaxID=869891 RepID=A0ABD6DC86_9EURY|nr:AbrB/MazE/SpoVT family DNA-binding domain-containing protein [Halohasta litorea]